MKEIIEKLNNEGKNFIVKFTAKWCGACKQIEPTLDILKNDINIVEFDIDTDIDYPKSLGIKSIPTLIIFKEGVEKDRLIGVVSKEQILEAFNKN